MAASVSPQPTQSTQRPSGNLTPGPSFAIDRSPAAERAKYGVASPAPSPRTAAAAAEDVRAIDRATGRSFAWSPQQQSSTASTYRPYRASTGTPGRVAARMPTSSAHTHSEGRIDYFSESPDRPRSVALSASAYPTELGRQAVAPATPTRSYAPIAAGAAATGTATPNAASISNSLLREELAALRETLAEHASQRAELTRERDALRTQVAIATGAADEAASRDALALAEMRDEVAAVKEAARAEVRRAREEAEAAVAEAAASVEREHRARRAAEEEARQASQRATYNAEAHAALDARHADAARTIEELTAKVTGLESDLRLAYKKHRTEVAALKEQVSYDDYKSRFEVATAELAEAREALKALPDLAARANAATQAERDLSNKLTEAAQRVAAEGRLVAGLRADAMSMRDEATKALEHAKGAAEAREEALAAAAKWERRARQERARADEAVAALESAVARAGAEARKRVQAEADGDAALATAQAAQRDADRSETNFLRTVLTAESRVKEARDASLVARLLTAEHLEVVLEEEAAHMSAIVDAKERSARELEEDLLSATGRARSEAERAEQLELELQMAQNEVEQLRTELEIAQSAQ